MSATATHRLITASAGARNAVAPSKAEVMRIRWARGPRMERVVSTAIIARRDSLYDHHDDLHAAGQERAARREKVERGCGYVYTATIGQQDIVAREVAGILESIVHEYPGALVQYLDARRGRVAGCGAGARWPPLPSSARRSQGDASSHLRPCIPTSTTSASTPTRRAACWAACRASSATSGT
jgi:hypothetical protein